MSQLTRFSHPSVRRLPMLNLAVRFDEWGIAIRANRCRQSCPHFENKQHLKADLDALRQVSAFWDDSQIDWLLTVRLNPVPDGQATIQIWQFSDGALPQYFSQQGASV